jgi:hypothetical protein
MLYSSCFCSDSRSEFLPDQYFQRLDRCGLLGLQESVLELVAEVLRMTLCQVQHGVLLTLKYDIFLEGKTVISRHI